MRWVFNSMGLLGQSQWRGWVVWVKKQMSELGKSDVVVLPHPPQAAALTRVAFRPVNVYIVPNVLSRGCAVHQGTLAVYLTARLKKRPHV